MTMQSKKEVKGLVDALKAYPQFDHEDKTHFALGWLESEAESLVRAAEAHLAARSGWKKEWTASHLQREVQRMRRTLKDLGVISTKEPNIREGMVKKGGLNSKPSTPRPKNPPHGQGGTSKCNAPYAENVSMSPPHESGRKACRDMRY